MSSRWNCMSGQAVSCRCKSVRSAGISPVRCGFTLLELVVALSVAALAITAGFAALALMADRAQHMETATKTTLEGVAARDMLVTWLSGARVRSQTMNVFFQGVERETGGFPDDELILPTVAATHLNAPTTVRLYIDREPATPQRGLVAELWTELDVEPVILEILPDAVGLAVSFLPETGGEEWLTEWPARQVLPRAVELLVLGDGAEALPVAFQLPIRVPLEARWTVDPAGRTVQSRELRVRYDLADGVAGVYFEAEPGVGVRR